MNDLLQATWSVITTIAIAKLVSAFVNESVIISTTTKVAHY